MDFGKDEYDHEEEDWLLAWSDMLNKHKLTENKWLKNLFKMKEKWVMVCGCHTLTIKMVSTQRSESMNNILKRYLKHNFDLLMFFKHSTSSNRRVESKFISLNFTVRVLNFEGIKHGLIRVETFQLIECRECWTYKSKFQNVKGRNG